MTQLALSEVKDYLDNWANWNRRGRPGQYPHHASGMYGAGNNDFDSMCEDMDIAHAKAVEAALEALQADERKAVHNHYLKTRWPVLGPVQALERACAKLAISLYAKGLPGGD